MNYIYMNKHLNSLMDGLTGKVFRTFNVSFTFFCKMGILGRGLGVPPWLSNVWWIWGIVPLLPGTLYGPLQALRDPKKGLNNTHMGCKMLKNAQIIHRRDLNSIELLFDPFLSPPVGHGRRHLRWKKTFGRPFRSDGTPRRGHRWGIIRSKLTQKRS